MKIDFDRIEVFTDLERTRCTVASLRKPLANALYSQGTGLACHALALKLWNTEGLADISEDEAAIITRLVDSSCAPAVIDAVKGLLDKAREDADNGDRD